MLTLTEQLISELDKSQTLKAAIMGGVDGDDETCSTLTMSISHRSRSSMLGTSLHSEAADPPPLMSYSSPNNNNNSNNNVVASPMTTSSNRSRNSSARRRNNTFQRHHRSSSIQHIMNTVGEQSFHNDDSGAAAWNNNNNMDASSSRLNTTDRMGSSSRRATMMNYRTNSFLRRHGAGGAAAGDGMEASLSSLGFGGGSDDMDRTSRRNNLPRRTTTPGGSGPSSRPQKPQRPPQRRASIQCSQPSRIAGAEDRMCVSYHSTTHTDRRRGGGAGYSRTIRRGSSFDPKMGTSSVHFERYDRHAFLEVSSRDEHDDDDEEDHDTLEEGEMSARFGMGSSFHHASSRRNTFQPFLESSFNWENSFHVSTEGETTTTTTTTTTGTAHPNSSISSLREGDLDYLDLSIRPTNLKKSKRDAHDGTMRRRPSLDFGSLIGDLKKTVQEEQKGGWANFWSNRVGTFQRNMDTIGMVLKIR